MKTIEEINLELKILQKEILRLERNGKTDQKKKREYKYLHKVQAELLSCENYNTGCPGTCYEKDIQPRLYNRKKPRQLKIIANPLA